MNCSELLKLNSDQITLKLWEELLVQAQADHNKAKSLVDNDPRMELFNIHKEFADFLNKTKGEERLTKKSIDFVSGLRKREISANRRIKSYDSMKAHNREMDLHMFVNKCQNEVSNRRAILDIRSRKYGSN